jgi:hypothetical protein
MPLAKNSILIQIDGAVIGRELNDPSRQTHRRRADPRADRAQPGRCARRVTR